MDNVMAVSTLLFCDGHKESEHFNSVSCVCVKRRRDQGVEAKKSNISTVKKKTVLKLLEFLSTFD